MHYQLGKCCSFSLKWREGLLFVYVSTWKTTRGELIPADITVTRQKAKPRREDSGKELKLSSLRVHVWRTAFFIFIFEVHLLPSSFFFFFSSFQVNKSHLFLSLCNPRERRRDSESHKRAMLQCHGKHTGSPLPLLALWGSLWMKKHRELRQ